MNNQNSVQPERGGWYSCYLPPVLGPGCPPLSLHPQHLALTLQQCISCCSRAADGKGSQRSCAYHTRVALSLQVSQKVKSRLACSGWEAGTRGGGQGWGWGVSRAWGSSKCFFLSLLILLRTHPLPQRQSEV